MSHAATISQDLLIDVPSGLKRSMLDDSALALDKSLLRLARKTTEHSPEIEAFLSGALFIMKLLETRNIAVEVGMEMMLAAAQELFPET